MPVANLDTCSNCNGTLHRDATYCPNCGQPRVPPGKSSSGGIVLMLVLGFIAGLPLALGGVVVGFTVPQRLFGANDLDSARLSIAYFLTVTALLVFGLIFMAKARASATLRAFAIAALTTALGIFAICDPIALLGLK